MAWIHKLERADGTTSYKTYWRDPSRKVRTKAFPSRLGHVPLHAITRPMVKSFLADLHEQGVRDPSINGASYRMRVHRGPRIRLVGLLLLLLLDEDRGERGGEQPEDSDSGQHQDGGARHDERDEQRVREPAPSPLRARGRAEPRTRARTPPRSAGRWPRSPARSRGTGSPGSARSGAVAAGRRGLHRLLPGLPRRSVGRGCYASLVRADLLPREGPRKAWISSAPS